MIRTFLFTDIESSTRLWEENRDEMPTALARHDSIMRNAVEAAGGRVLKTMGDGLVALFATVEGAVSASILAQRDLTSEAWTTRHPIKARMGVHVGEAEERDDDFYGPTLNRTARIMAAAHGGQVLLSGTAATMVREHLDGATALRDLGTHRLKDLTSPEHLFQLVVADIPSEFPAPNTLDSTPNNLPYQTTEFFGREQELAAITEMLDDPSIRLLTLLGPGGTGKTRLAIQAAAEKAGSFEHGAFFVDLSTEREPGPAFEAVARNLAVPLGSEGDSLRALKTWLRDRDMLIVLDNFEQVTSAAAGVAELIEQCPRLQILVTSREALRVRSEHIYPVPPMSVPAAGATPAEIGQSEAVRLFLDRARSIRPDFTLSIEDSPIIAAICARLDGLPLAIELAAARLNIFSPADLLRRLEERMDVLASRGRDVPERQQTLWGAIEWSYQLLDEDDRRIFELISAFSTASLEAVEAVSAAAIDRVDALDSLTSLVDKSLIRGQDIGGTRRFSMLQTVREYAIARLDSDPEWAKKVGESHAVYYSDYTRALAGLLTGPKREETLERMSIEIGNLRSAWKFWVESGDLGKLFSLIDGLWALNDARGWYHAALELARDMLDVLATTEDSEDHTDDELALRMSLARAMMALRGYGPEVEAEFQRAADLGESTGSSKGQAPVQRALASYYTMTGRFEEAARAARRIIEMAEAEGNQALAVEGHLALGGAILDQSEAALEHLDKAIEFFDPTNVGASRFRLGASPGVVARMAAGIVRWRTGELDRALDLTRDAIQIARDLDHPFSLAYALYHTGFIHTQRGRFDLSLECARELHAVATEQDYQIWEALAKVIEGVSLAGSGQVGDGLALTETGVELYQGLTTPPVFWPLILSLRSFAHLCAGAPDMARSLIEEAIGIMGEESMFPEFLVQRGDIIAAHDGFDRSEAEDVYRHAASVARRLGLHYVELAALNRLVTIYREQGEPSDLSERLAEVLDLIEGGAQELETQTARALLDA